MNLLVAIVSVQSPSNSVDQRLSSHFLIYKKYTSSILNYITSTLTFKVHVIHIEYRRGNISCKKYDLVNKQIDTDCRQLD